MKKALHELNRLPWNTATVAHNRHKGNQAAFFRNGGSTLFPEERELLGNLAGLPARVGRADVFDWMPDGMPRLPLMVAIAAHREAA